MGCQRVQYVGERPDSITIYAGCVVAVIQSRVTRSAPAEASLRDSHIAVGEHLAAVVSTRRRHIVHHKSSHRGSCTCSGEHHLVAIGGSNTVPSVGAHIVGGVRRQACERVGKQTDVAAVRAVAIVTVIQRRVRGRAPAETSFGNVNITVGEHLTSKCGHGCRHIADDVGT